LDFFHSQLRVRVFDRSSEEKVATVETHIFPAAVPEIVKTGLRSIALKGTEFLYYGFDASPRALEEIFNDYSAIVL
jgi:phosphoenolpyruvate-protein kinase (PTS system EI component)